MSRKPRKKTTVAAQYRCISAADWRRLHLPGSPSKFRTDPELRAYVDEVLPQMSFKQIAAACQKKFGPGRAPGKSAVHRYWQTVRPPEPTGNRRRYRP